MYGAVVSDFGFSASVALALALVLVLVFSHVNFSVWFYIGLIKVRYFF